MAFVTDDPRCKMQPFSMFETENLWHIDKWWSKEEKIELGIEEQETVLSLDEFKEKIMDIEREIHQINDQLQRLS